MARRNEGEATRFLKSLYGDYSGGRIEVRVKNKDDEIVTREFVTTFAAVEDLVGQYGGRLDRNAVYYGVGKRGNLRNGKKKNVVSVPALWADIDINKLSGLGWKWETTVRAFEDLPYTLRPSALVNSGGGLHAYWFLDEPVSLEGLSDQDWNDEVRRFETVCKAVQGHMGSDMVWDVSRVLRLPGSFNARAGKAAHIIWCYHWQRASLDALADAIEDFDLYLGPDGFVTKDELPKRREDGLDHKKALELNWEETGRGWLKRHDQMWESTRLGGGYPFIGLDEAQLRATALRYSYSKDKPDVIVREVLRHTLRIKKRDAKDESWNMDAEAQKIRDKLDRWMPKWDAMEKARRAETRRLRKEREDAEKDTEQ